MNGERSKMNEEQTLALEEIGKIETVKVYNQAYVDKQEKHIKELEAQIEKMINEVDKTMVLSNMRECEIYDIQEIFRKYNFKRNSNDIWEIKEK